MIKAFFGAISTMNSSLNRVTPLDEANYYTLANQFLRKLNISDLTSLKDLDAKLKNINDSLITFLNNAKTEKPVTQTGDAQTTTETYLNNYKTTFDEFNAALETTTKALLEFKTQIVYERGDKINEQFSVLQKFFGDEYNMFTEKLDSIISRY